MIKPTVKRGLMLDFVPDIISKSIQINPARVINYNNTKVKDGDIIYLMSRELRVQDNWALLFAHELAQKHQTNLKVLINPIQFSENQKQFLNSGLAVLTKNLQLNKIDYEFSDKIPKNIGALIIDFNPLQIKIYKSNFQGNTVFEVDSHNIIPARFISDKQEFSAATLRRKIYANIGEFLTEYPSVFKTKEIFGEDISDDFVENKLENYAQNKNNPLEDSVSKLSPYLHFGFIPAQKTAINILKSAASRENKEAFLEELIVRKELSDNFCLYNDDYKSLNHIYPWAKQTLYEHKDDLRSYTYNLDEFEKAKTHDSFWNTIQMDLTKTGRIHGYLRMYWAKKILEWSKSPEEALKIAIYLNDTYALDGNDPNGYVGILWSIAGIHDRPFTNRFVTGKIRYMSLDGCRKKFDVEKYIALRNYFEVN